MLTKEDGFLDFRNSAEENERFIRGMYSWPAAQAVFRGRSVKILKASVLPDDKDLLPGTVSEVSKHGFSVRCGEGALAILSLQPEGKRVMTADEFLRGYRVLRGERFETPAGKTEEKENDPR